MVRALRRFGLTAEPYVPSRLEEGHGLSLRAVEVAAAAGHRVIITVDTGSSSVSQVDEANRRGDRCPDHRPPPRTGGPAGGPGPGESASARLELSGSAPGRQRCGLQGGPAAPGRPARRPAGGPGPGRTGRDRHRGRRRPDPRREPGDRPDRPRADQDGAARRAGGAACPGRPGAGLGRSRDRLVRDRAPPQRRRPGGQRGRRRGPPPDRRPGRGGRACRATRSQQRGPPGDDPEGGPGGERRGCLRARRRCRDARPGHLADRRDRPRGGPPGRGALPAGGRRDRARRRDPGLLPECRRRSTWPRSWPAATTC